MLIGCGPAFRSAASGRPEPGRRHLAAIRHLPSTIHHPHNTSRHPRHPLTGRAGLSLVLVPRDTVASDSATPRLRNSTTSPRFERAQSRAEGEVALSPITAPSPHTHTAPARHVAEEEGHRDEGEAEARLYRPAALVLPRPRRSPLRGRQKLRPSRPGRPPL